MNELRAFELLSAGLDGDLSPEEKTELEQLLAESAEARRLQGELTELDRILADAPDQEPPADLADSIVERTLAAAPEPRQSLWDWLPGLQFGPVLRYGFSVALGALLAIAVYETQPDIGPSGDITELVGTMAPDADPAGREILDSLSFERTGVSSVARLERRDEALVIDVRIDTTQTVEISLDFADSGFDFEALAQSELDSIEFAGENLKVKGRGQRRFAVLLRSRSGDPIATEAKIDLEYSSDGDVLQQGTLRLVR